MTVAADAYPWETAPRGVSSVDGSLAAVPRVPGVSSGAPRQTLGRTDGALAGARRGPDGALHATVPDDRS